MLPAFDLEADAIDDGVRSVALDDAVEFEVGGLVSHRMSGVRLIRWLVSGGLRCSFELPGRHAGRKRSSERLLVNYNSHSTFGPVMKRSSVQFPSHRFDASSQR
jgi:hypothetical protein